MKPFQFSFEILQIWRAGQSCLLQGGALMPLTIKLVVIKDDANSYGFSIETIFLRRSHIFVFSIILLGIQIERSLTTGMLYLRRLDEFKKIVDIFSVKSCAHIKTNKYLQNLQGPCSILLKYDESFTAQNKQLLTKKTTTTITSLVVTEQNQETTIFCSKYTVSLNRMNALLKFDLNAFL